MNKADIIRTAHQMAQQGQAAMAAQQLQQVVSAFPGDPDYAHHLGLILLSQGGIDAAMPYLERSVQLAPGMADYRSNYATALNMRGRHAEAAQEYRRAIAVRPDAFAAQIGLASALISTMDYEGALGAARQASAIDPGRPEPWINMAIALTRCGRGAEGIATIEKALKRFADHPVLLTQLVANLHYRPEIDPDRIRTEHERLGRLMLARTPPPHPFANTREPDRPLRVAYVSQDFHDHSVMHFFRPVLAAHDPAQAEVFLYSATMNADGVTAQVQASGAKWRDISRMPDQGIEELMRGDQIDLAVDLAGHTGGSRISALARRVAPVQASYIGYPNTTGVPTIDYRIVDEHTDPAGAERYSTERLVRIPGCFLAYRPPDHAPEVGPAPSASGAPPVFGSFNAAQKIVEPVIEAWAAILKAVPGSRLLLKAQAWESASARKDYLAMLARAGAAPERVELLARIPDAEQHLALYHRVDVALDTFPYNGTTTTCEALWMGVPVVALAGRAHAGRVGVSLLNAVGLPDLVAETPEAYARVATDLAREAARLASLRASMRERVRGSVLCDGPGFTRKLEAAYREMWRSYCGEAAGG
ncbi:MAG: tetratricopeptide repeat protein [Phycisphaerales bacterium]